MAVLTAQVVVVAVVCRGARQGGDRGRGGADLTTITVIHWKIAQRISRAWCKTIVTTSFYIRSYNNFAPSPRYALFSVIILFYLRKSKSSGSIVCMWKKAASVLLKLLINSF